MYMHCEITCIFQRWKNYLTEEEEGEGEEGGEEYGLSFQYN